ncbi:hypothetical protein [Nitrosomonas sp. Nm51]|uniref:hypothetical protein n=1 Tax=Nitrosomonas sp. Nm51 TaxID=133720 RepID=UPI00115F898B|nr:hypothetical protein [Nitrosomonas sp. Nm51]
MYRKTGRLDIRPYQKMVAIFGVAAAFLLVVGEPLEPVILLPVSGIIVHDCWCGQQRQQPMLAIQMSLAGQALVGARSCHF